MNIKGLLLKAIEDYFLPFVGKILVWKNKYCNVIYYHDIVDGEGYSYMKTNYDVFVSQMLYLKENGYETLRFDDLNDETIKFKTKRVLIAFDDGWRSNYDKIFEFMKANGLKYNVFLTMGEIGHNPDYLTWNQVRKMHNSGLCGFGVHTFSHPDMSELCRIDYHKEIDEANELFEKELGYAPKDFCYPFGYYSEKSNQKLLACTQYERIYTSMQFFSYLQQGKIVFGRNGINNESPMHVFVKRVKGYYNVSYYYQKTIYNRILKVYHIFKKPKNG